MGRKTKEILPAQKAKKKENLKSLPLKKIENFKKKSSFRNEKRKSCEKDQNSLYIPCINCDNLVNVEDIDFHSNQCVTVKKEVYETDYDRIKGVNFKLSKLEENLIRIKSRPDFDSNKDNYYLLTLFQYVQDALNDIDNSSPKNLKKILVNIETLIVKFKGSFATGVLLERAKYLVKEKHKLSREETKKSRSNLPRVSFVEELEKKKDEKEKAVDKLHLEKEKLKNKVKCYQNQRKSESRARSPTYERKAVTKRIEDFRVCSEDTHQKNEESEFEIDMGLYNYKPPAGNNHILNDISSDVDNMSIRSFNSELSNSTFRMSTKSVDFESLQANLSSSKNSFFTNKIEPNQPSQEDVKKMYKNFVKVVLKIKFEKMKNNHPGQKIPEKVLFHECLKLEVPQDKFEVFIEEEINNFEKYSAYLTKPQKTNKLSRNRLTKFQAQPVMDIINEESF